MKKEWEYANPTEEINALRAELERLREENRQLRGYATWRGRARLHRIEEAAREVDKDWIDRWEGPPSLAVLGALRAALERESPPVPSEEGPEGSRGSSRG